uniref:DUF4283 domain-containing protein n=1 Tax=Cannabis sativa TaxID=3483 RepID=A0A803PL64_CANSA
MEVVNTHNESLKGKAFSCVKASISLTPSATSLKVSSSLCLFGKVVAPMVMDAGDVTDAVTKNWQKRVVVSSLSNSCPNCFKLGFENTLDRDWALDHGPWSFKGYTFALRMWSPSCDGSVTIDIINLWVQIHNLPHEFFSNANGHLLGSLIGKVIKVELEEDNPMSWNLFLRVLVEVNIEKLLVSGCYFDLANGVKRWLQFKVVTQSVPVQRLALMPVCSLLNGSSTGTGNGGATAGGTSNDERGSRKKSIGTFRPLPGKAVLSRKKWVPKDRSGDGVRSHTGFGNGVRIISNGNENGSANFPCLEKMTNGKGAINPLTPVLCVEMGPTGVVNIKDNITVNESVISNFHGPQAGLKNLVGTASGPTIVNAGEMVGLPNCSGPGAGSLSGKILGAELTTKPNEEKDLLSPLPTCNVKPLSKTFDKNNASLKIGGPIIGEGSSLGQVGGKEAEPNGEEERPQEQFLYDLKHFGRMDLFEIKKICGDIGIFPTSKTNVRTTPFKKRKFEGSASLCTRPHKVHRKYPDVVRDFPWDPVQPDLESKVVEDDPSEESSSSPSYTDGILKNPLVGSFVIKDSDSNLSVHSNTPVEENVLSPPQEP